MASSGSYSFGLNYMQLLTTALQMINVYEINQTPGSDDIAFAGNILNAMVKMWEVEGVRLWKRRQATLFPALNTYQYQIGPMGANCSNEYVSTTINSPFAANATLITVLSTAGMAVGMNIGIEQDNGVRYWDTISAINGNVITLTNGSTTTTGQINNTVIAYAALVQRPLRILRATALDLKNNNTESVMMPQSYDEYFNYPLKSIAGRPNNFYYDKQLNNGTLYLFPNPNQVWVLIQFTYQEAIQDFLNPTNTMDLPQEWVYPLVFNLAVDLAQFYGKFIEVQALQPKADKYKAILDNFDSDEELLDISFDMGMRRRL